MAIDYNANIASLFNANVATETSYQIPGDFHLPAGFGVISLATAAVAEGGTGYTVNDVLTLVGGTSTTAAQVKVTAVATGVVTAIQVSRVGVYTVSPTGPLAVTGGSGEDCTIDATWNGFAQRRILTFVELTRAYMAQIDNPHEAKLLLDVMGRMMANLKIGTRWNGAARATAARNDSMHFIAGHVIPSDI